MKYLFITLGFVCLALTFAAYEFNQTLRKEWIMDLVGIIGVLAFFISLFLLGIGLTIF